MSDGGINTVGKKRLLVELETHLRKINAEIINPEIPELHLGEIDPVISLVARARAAYLKELMAVANSVGDGLPNGDQIKRLRNYRITYEELLNGSQALHTAIERGYLDVLQP